MAEKFRTYDEVRRLTDEEIKAWTVEVSTKVSLSTDTPGGSLSTEDLTRRIRLLQLKTEQQERDLEYLRELLAVAAEEKSKLLSSREASGAPTTAESSYRTIAKLPVGRDTKLAVAHPIVLAILRAVGGSITLTDAELRAAHAGSVEVLQTEFDGSLIVREFS